MTFAARRRTVRLTAAAEGDFRDIVHWMLAQFGERQALVYAETLSAALRDLAAGSAIASAKRRDEIAKGVFSLHVARNRRRGRHVVLFRVVRGQGNDSIEILRILHDAMDFARYLPPTDDPS